MYSLTVLYRTRTLGKVHLKIILYTFRKIILPIICIFKYWHIYCTDFARSSFRVWWWFVAWTLDAHYRRICHILSLLWHPLNDLMKLINLLLFFVVINTWYNWYCFFTDVFFLFIVMKRTHFFNIRLGYLFLNRLKFLLLYQTSFIFIALILFYRLDYLPSCDFWTCYPRGTTLFT